MGFSERIEMLLIASKAMVAERMSIRNYLEPTECVIYNGKSDGLCIKDLMAWTKCRTEKTAIKHYVSYLEMLGNPEYIILVKTNLA
jgi:hypothetical protein